MDVNIDFGNGEISISVNNFPSGSEFSIIVTSPLGGVVGTLGTFDVSNPAFSVAIPTQNGVELEGTYSFETTAGVNLPIANEFNTTHKYCPFRSINTEVSYSCGDRKISYSDNSNYPDDTTVTRVVELVSTDDTVVFDEEFATEDEIFDIVYGGVEYKASTTATVVYDDISVVSGDTDIVFGVTVVLEQDVSVTVECYDTLCLLSDCINAFYNKIKDKVLEAGGFEYISKSLKDKYFVVTSMLMVHKIGTECSNTEMQKSAFQKIKETLNCDCCGCDEKPYVLQVSSDSELDVVSGDNWITRSKTNTTITLGFNDSLIPVKSITQASSRILINEVNGAYTIGFDDTGLGGGGVSQIVAGSGIVITTNGNGDPVISLDGSLHAPVSITNTPVTDKGVVVLQSGTDNQTLSFTLNYSVGLSSSQASGQNYMTVSLPSGITNSSPIQNYNVTLNDEEVTLVAAAPVGNATLGAGTRIKVGQVVAYSRVLTIKNVVSGVTPSNVSFAGIVAANNRPRRTIRAFIHGVGHLSGGLAGMALIGANGNIDIFFYDNFAGGWSGLSGTIGFYFEATYLV